MARESIDALLNPSLKVSRPVSACKKCRTAKIKCDGKLPACSACERAGKAKECSSANDDFARGKERSYVAALEIAAQRLQRKIDERKANGYLSKRDSLLMLAHGRPSLQRRPVSRTQRKEAGSVDELVSDFGFLTVNATSRDFQGFSATMSFAKMLRAIAMKDNLPAVTDVSIPPRHTNISNTGGASTFSFRHVVLSTSASDIFGITVPTAGDEHDDSAIRNVSIAMEVMEYVIYPGSVSGIQALLLLTQYSVVDPAYFDDWYLAGMTARLVVDLGLHCEPSPETTISKHALDQRRRVFYCTYALDRLISMARGLAFSFTDDSAPNVLLPTLATDQEARSPSQVFTRSVRPSLFLFDIRRVQSAYYQQTGWSSRKQWPPDTAASYISSTLDDVQSWFSTIPSSFSQRHLQLFYLESLYTQSLVLSPNEVIPISNISNMHKMMFFNCAVQYSDQLRSMIQSTVLQQALCYPDFCRAHHISRQFQNLMWANFDLFMREMQTPTSPNQRTPTLEHCARALTFLSNLSLILEWPKQRWGISTLHQTFVQESAVLLARLQTRQQEYSGSQSPPGALPFGMFPQTTAGTTGSFPAFSQSQDNSSVPHTHMSNYAFQQSMPDAHNPAISDLAQRANPAMHRSNLFRTSEWSPHAEQAHPELPHGSLPRRSYQFRGGES